MARTPAYREVYQSLKQQIKEKRYPCGTLLPTEPELEQQFSVSRTTVRKAVSMLAADGYVKVTQGKGTEVLDTSTVQKLNSITSITEALTAKGYCVTTQGMDIRKTAAGEQVAQALEIPEGEEVYQIQRLQCADGIPIAIMTNYLKVGQTPGLESYSGTFSGLYSFLEQKYNIVMREAVEYLSAVAASFTEAQLLHIEVGAPLLCSRRISCNSLGVFEYSVNKLVADKYEYCVYLHGREDSRAENKSSE
mgnify:CR=1 FL=1